MIKRNAEPDTVPRTIKLLTSRETAQALQVSERTLYSLTTPRGSLPACRVGRSVRYRLCDVEKYLESLVN